MPPKNFSKSRSTGNEPRATIYKLFFLVSFFFFCAVRGPWSVALADSATAESAMVVTQHPEATKAALQVLKDGGNAAEAAVAAQLVLNVVEPQGSGLGGGGFFIYYDHVKRSIRSFDGRETAPASATPGMFLQDGKPLAFFPDRITGGTAVGVPGTPALIEKILRSFSDGHISLAKLAEPAILLAEKGAPVSESLAARLAENAERLKTFPQTAKVFLNDDGTPLKAGDNLIQPDLAKTLKLFGAQGAAPFYSGEVAQAIAETVSQAPLHPAEFSVSDLKNYSVIERDPLHGNYRGMDIFTPGLPTSGGIVLMQALNILETVDMPTLGWDHQALHYMNEVQKNAFRSRKELGDPAFSKADLDKILSKDFAKNVAAQIEPEKAGKETSPVPQDGGQTSHISIVDRWGNMASWTSTVEAPFGSGLTVKGYGFLLNNELTDFDAEPRDAVGSIKPNAVEPGKRPLSSMTPALVFMNGKPYMILGSPGGTTIIGTVMNVLVNKIDFGMSCEEAVAKPRLIYRGDKMEMEPIIYNHPTIRLQLELWGHDTRKDDVIGNAQVVCYDASRQEYTGVSDPRGIGSAAGY